MKRLFWYVSSFLLAPSVMAQANDVDLGSPAAGPLAAIGGFMQEVVDFAGGPGVLFIAFISAVAAVALWVAAPKQGGAAIAWALRVCVGVIILMNIALLITWFQSF
ncbi:MAG TPA: hypothetical protein ENI17_02680 [Pseudomonas xinjiangensis]|uniref:Type IV secretion system protein VirB2 n=2 Tax=root TaxID=1 RepID=A0A7V1FU01_9GAMM|nr:hypothetical protein [Halopseudomonas xinjiangensis]HEC46515.1 hypothetical protein [Halopseudomonas xinjiangensis]